MAIRFTRTSSQNATDTTPASLPTDAFTMGCWFRLVTTTAASQYFFTVEDSAETNDYILLRINTSPGSEFSVLTKIGATTKQITGAGASVDTWYYATVGRSGANYFLKVFNSDGTLLTDTSATDNSTASWTWNAGAEWNLGSLASAGGFTDCRIRNAWTANSYISVNADLWVKARNPVPTANLTHLWPVVDENDTGDDVGTDTLTMVNTPTNEADPTFPTVATAGKFAANIATLKVG